MEFYALGTGSASCTKNYQSNYIIRQNGKYLLIDCGGDVRFAIDELFGLKMKDIDAVYISHLHGDHIHGVEHLAFGTKFIPNFPRPKFYAEASLCTEAWDKSLRGGLEGLEGVKYLEKDGLGVNLATYCEVHPISRNGSFVWEGIKFEIIQTVHIVCKYSLSMSFGLMWTDPDTNERVYITTDTQFSPELSMLALWKEADVVFQDCETGDYKFKSGVHAHYEDLKTLPDAVRAKMWLTHYGDNVVADWDTWQARAIADGFRGFVKTYASFARSYTQQEGGYVGSLAYVAKEYMKKNMGQ
jgi:ribonuclease BN (tRNA processing enzyme)